MHSPNMKLMNSLFFDFLKLTLISLLCILTFVTNCQVSQIENEYKIVKKNHSNQAWYLEIQKEMPNYQIVKEAYDAYFDIHPFERSPQKNQVRRWLMTSRPVVSDDGLVRRYTPSREDHLKISKASLAAQKAYQSFPRQGDLFRSMESYPNETWNDSVGTWRMIGPYHNRTHNMFGGFNDRVFINRFNTDNMIAGQSFGGLWTTQDGGATWKLTDAEYPNGNNTYSNRDMYYGDIEVHPIDADRIVVGSDAGVLISNDAGESWDLADQLNYIDMPSERSYFIAQKNDDIDVILASYGTRIYRSTDSGETWSVVFDNSAVTHRRSTYQHTTNGVYHRWYNFAGLEFDHDDPNIVYLAAVNSNNQTCLHKSTDAGLTFTQIANTGSTKWLKMIHTPGEPDFINFATIFTSLQSPNSDEGIYKYDEDGNLTSFTVYPQNPDARSIDDVMQSQTDPDVWVASGYSSNKVFYSNDGGATYNTSIDNTHADLRAFAIVGDTVLVGTDGGLHISYNGGENLKEASQWISGIDLWGFSSAFKGELVAAGDDHGPTEFRITDADRSWHRTGGADSEHVQINKCDQNFAYGRDVYSPFLGEKINDSTFIRRGNYIPDGNFKYLAQDPDECYKFYPTDDNLLKISTNNMVNQDVLHTFSQDVTKVEVVLKDNNTIYVLEGHKVVHKSIDAGSSWTIITPPSSVTNGKTQIQDIETDETGSNIWLAYGQNQTSCKVVHSDDGGATWTNITGSNLPAFAVNHITYQRGTEGMVYIGLRPGSVWYKDDNTADWSMLGSGLPTMGYITTMYIIPDMGKLRMGSSRGAWEHDLPVASDVVSHFSVSSRNSSSCYLDTIKFFDYSSYYGATSSTFAWTFEGGTPSTSTEMNPKVVYTTPGIYDVTLQVTDANGQSDTYTREDFMTIFQAETCGPDQLPSFAYQNTSNYHYMTAPSMDVENTQTYTMMAWVKGEGVQGEYAGILSHRTSNGSVHLNVRSVGQDSTEIGYHHPNGQWWWSSGLYLVPNQWTHLALVIEPDGIYIYKNGVGKKHNRTVEVADLVEEFRIGGMIGRNDRCFKGMIDEVAFYSSALSETDIRTMMHLTKENPDYVDQHESTIESYYQFNEMGNNTIIDVTGNGRNAVISSQVSIIESDGPFGGGRSQLIEVEDNTLHNFDDPGVQIQFSTSNPDGPIVVSHLDNLPDIYPAQKMHDKGYYIIDNYGLNTTFDPLSMISFDKTGTISNTVASTGAGFKIWKRGTHIHDIKFTEVISTNISATAGIQGSIKADDASPIISFGQFAITRDLYPAGNPKSRMTTPENASEMIVGGESMSVYIDSDYQGFKLPVLTTSTLANIGMPANGSLAYSDDMSALIVFSEGKWNTVKSAPLLNTVNGTTQGTETIRLGSGDGVVSSAILNASNTGFIKVAHFDDQSILDIKYPTEGLLLYNSSSEKYQYFNGNNWKDLPTVQNSTSVSTSTIQNVEGITINAEGSGNNALLDDQSTDATIMIPTLTAESIMNPIRGLLIFDTSRNAFLFFDGQLWNKVGE